ncbi:MAG TPA: hypothetical protein VID67_03680 [Rhizomicrobium sp.]
MNNTEARDWAKDFENKDESELAAMKIPAGLSMSQIIRWKKAKQAAEAAAFNSRKARERAQKASAPDSEMVANDDAQGRADEPLTASRTERTRLLLDEMHDAELRAKARVDTAQIPLILPDGDAAMLLEKQIASSAALIGYLSNYVARNDTDPSVCMSFMDRMTAMLGASANVGKVVGHLRGQVSRTEQYINVNRLEGERGRGRG